MEPTLKYQPEQIHRAKSMMLLAKNKPQENELSLVLPKLSHQYSPHGVNIRIVNVETPGDCGKQIFMIFLICTESITMILGRFQKDFGDFFRLLLRALEKF